MRGPSRGLLSIVGSIAVGAAACGGDPAVVDPTPPAAEDWTRDVTDTALSFDLVSREASATLTLAGGESQAASFEVGDLAIASVTAADGTELEYEVRDAQLDIGVPASEDPVAITVEYQFTYHDNLEGADDAPAALTLTWPDNCGNLFPCKTRDNPADGTLFTLELSGVPDSMVAVYPETIPSEAPPYQVAWSIDAYEELALGETSAGTEVVMWHHAGNQAIALAGGAHLLAGFEWLEQNIGPYRFGDKVGTVAVGWGGGAFGGMEHHPYWHVATTALDDEETNVHEAAHGWYGDGIRIRCWEDFVLSEGTVTYLAARVLEEVGGAALGQQIWNRYQTELNQLANTTLVAWPDSCGTVSIDDLFNNAPYTKGAYFYRAVAGRVGADVLDEVLATFYAEWGGKAAGMQDMLDTIEAETGWDPTACSDKWLRASTVPTDLTCP